MHSDDRSAAARLSKRRWGECFPAHLGPDLRFSWQPSAAFSSAAVEYRLRLRWRAEALWLWCEVRGHVLHAAGGAAVGGKCWGQREQARRAEVAVEVVSAASAEAGLSFPAPVWLAALPRHLEPGCRSPGGTVLRGELTGQSSLEDETQPRPASTYPLVAAACEAFRCRLHREGPGTRQGQQLSSLWNYSTACASKGKLP